MAPITPPLIPWNPKAELLDRRHQQLVANLLNSLILQGLLTQTGFGWTLVVSGGTAGPAGPPGAPGSPGPMGATGSLPQRGAIGTPRTAPPRMGKVGDLELDSLTGNVWQLQLAGPFEPPRWVLLTNLLGAVGPQGMPGPPGQSGPVGPTGSTGLTGVTALDYSVSQGRLTLTSGTAITTADVTAATTVYWTPFRGAQIALYYSSAWSYYTFVETSLAVPATTNTPFDIFVSWSGSALALTAVSWTNTTARATVLATQDGILCLSGDATKKYLGTCCTTAVSGQCNDSLQNRFVYNWYNQVDRRLFFDVQAAHSYNGGIRAFNNSSANNVMLVVGGLSSLALTIGCASVQWNYGEVGAALDSTTTIPQLPPPYTGGSADGVVSANYSVDVPIGQHTININEAGGSGSHQNEAALSATIRI